MLFLGKIIPVLEKTRGIVLHYTRYSDSSGIVNMLTENRGRQAFMVRGATRGKKAGRMAMLQPLMILSIDVSDKPGREVQDLRDFSLDYVPSSIPFSIQKNSVAMFLGEILNAAIREEVADKALFSYIMESVVWFDRQPGPEAGFHLLFLTGLTRHLGFGPSLPSSEDQKLFDMTSGIFCSMPPASGVYMDMEYSAIMKSLLSASVSDSDKPAITAAESETHGITARQRRQMLELIIKYYSIHLPGFKNLKSMKILKEVFTG